MRSSTFILEVGSVAAMLGSPTQKKHYFLMGQMRRRAARILMSVLFDFLPTIADGAGCAAMRVKAVTADPSLFVFGLDISLNISILTHTTIKIRRIQQL